MLAGPKHAACGALQMQEERAERMNEVNRMCEDMMANAREVERASMARAAQYERQAAAANQLRGPAGLLARMNSAVRPQVRILRP